MKYSNDFDNTRMYPKCYQDQWEINYRKLKDSDYCLMLAKQLICQEQTYLIPVVSKDWKVGFINADSCELAIEPLYDEIKGWFYSEQSQIAVRKGKRWGVIDSDGQVVIPFNYTDIVLPIESSMFAVQKWMDNGKSAWGVIDAKEKPVVPFDSRYLSIEGYDHGVCRVHAKDEGWAVFNEKGEEVVQFGVYDNILPIYDSGYSYIRMERTTGEGGLVVNIVDKRTLAGKTTD